MSRYESGSALAAIAEGSAALFDDETPVRIVERIWRAQHEGGSDDALSASLGILVEAFGVNGLPAFCLAVAGVDGARVVVRGPFEAVIDGGAHAGETIRADSPTFWTERHVADATGILLHAPGENRSDALPLRDGVVRAGVVVLGTSELARDAPAEPHASQDAPSGGGDLPGGAGAGGDIPSAEQGSPPPPSRSDAPERHADPEPDAPSSSDPVPAPVAGTDSAPPVVAQPAPGSTAAPEAPTPTTSARDGETLSPPDDTFATSDPSSAALPVEEGTTAYDDLIFGLTRAASVEDAAVRTTDDDPPSVPAQIGMIPVAGPSVLAAPTTAPLGDHDGLTVSAQQLAALRARTGVAASEPSATPGGQGSPGHVVLVSSTGERTVLDRGAVVGVRPSAVRATGTVPHLIAVPSPSGEISRRHLEIRVEAAHVLAVDLDSTNGTRLLRVGSEPVRLHPGAATLLTVGDRLDLGDGVELSFEGLR